MALQSIVTRAKTSRPWTTATVACTSRAEQNPWPRFCRCSVQVMSSTSPSEKQSQRSPTVREHGRELPSTILVVDDDEDTATLLCEALDRRGYRSVPLSSGADRKSTRLNSSHVSESR